MLPKEHRLKKKQDIDKIFIKGESLKSSLLICRFLENGLSYDRPCFTIAKKIKLNAVTRNRLKRKLTYALTDIIKNTANTDRTKHFDFIFILVNLPNKQTSYHSQIKSNLTYLMSKISNV